MYKHAHTHVHTRTHTRTHTHKQTYTRSTHARASAHKYTHTHAHAHAHAHHTHAHTGESEVELRRGGSRCSRAPSARQTAAMQPLGALRLCSAYTGMQTGAAPATIADCIPWPRQLQAELFVPAGAPADEGGTRAVKMAAWLRAMPNAAREPATFATDLRAKWKLSAVMASNSPPLMPCNEHA
jgi:hypothetical protein